MGKEIRVGVRLICFFIADMLRALIWLRGIWL